MDEFSAVCGSEQMSVGSGGVQVPGEMLLAGAVGVARHPSPSSQELASEGARYAQGSGKSTGCRLRGTTGGRGT